MLVSYYHYYYYCYYVTALYHHHCQHTWVTSVSVCPRIRVLFPSRTQDLGPLTFCGIRKCDPVTL